MGKGEKVKVSLRAVMQRINRRLAQDDEVLKTVRSERARLDLGNFYTVNTRRNLLTGKHVDVEALARELEVLEEWETILWPDEEDA